MPNTVNYELRSRVFQLDDTEHIYKFYKLYRRVEYCKIYNLRLPADYHPEIHEDDFLFLQAFYPAEWQECEKIYKADKARSRRLKIKIRYMLVLSRCSFVTFTFTDSVLSSTSSASRRQYVSRWLSSLDCAYIANVDYGDSTGREHYHAIVACRIPKSKLLEWILNYGALHVEPVRNCLTSSVRLSKYVSKLCNHTVKISCKRGALLFSRKYKLPSTVSDYNKCIEEQKARILDKGYFLCIDSTHLNTNFRTFRPSIRRCNSLVARCCQCGSVIPVPSVDLSKYTLTVNKNGRTKKLFFCADCIKEYKIKI